MFRLRFAPAAVAGLWLAAGAAVAQEPALMAAHGVVAKATTGTLTVRPRGADGKFEKEIAFHLTGTSKITTLSMQTRGGRPVPVQTDASAKDLKDRQDIAVIYTQGANGPVLLTAVVRPTK
jgi:hypothetical protein